MMRDGNGLELVITGPTSAGWKKVMVLGVVGANNALGGGYIMSGKEGCCCREQQVLSGVRECSEDGCAGSQSVKGSIGRDS